MPLMSKSRAYKHLPADIADVVIRHAKHRTSPKYKNGESDSTHEEETRKETLKKKHEPTSDTCSSSEEPSISKRQKTPKSTRSDDTCSDGVSTPRTPQSARNSESHEALVSIPLSDGSDFSSRGFMPIRPPSVMDVDRSNSCSPTNMMTLRPRLQRCESRTTTSLDNVEMWESDSEIDISEDKYDRINGVVINPRKTFDFSELRRNRTSPRLPQTVTNSPSLRPRTSTPKSTPTKPSSPNRSVAACSRNTFSQLTVTASPRNAAFSNLPNSRKKQQRTLPLKISPMKPSITKQTTKYQSCEHAKEPTSNVQNLPKISLKNAQNNPFNEASRNKHENSAFDNYIRDSIPRPSPMTKRPKSPLGGTLTLAISCRRDSTKMETDPSNSSRPATPSQEMLNTFERERKVKFNNLVDITDGENSSTDILRRSSKNSANFIKQKYLKSTNIRQNSPIRREENRSPEYWGIVC